MFGSFLGAVGAALARVGENMNRTQFSNSNSFDADSRVRVQVQDESGMWRDTSYTENNPQVYSIRASEASRLYPGKRIRVVDDYNRVVDIF
jgi:hypothetical protein